MSFAELDEQFTSFIKQEDQTLWDQGDALVAYNPTDEEFTKLAEHHNRAVKTLKTRMKVANEFKPESRHAGSFYVYAQLLKVNDPGKRQSILTERPPGEWTVDAMGARVTQYLRDTGSTRRVYDMRRAGMRLGEYRVTGELDGLGLMLTITNGDLSEALVAHQTVGHKIVVHVGQ
jgi:hypothetical protein